MVEIGKIFTERLESKFKKDEFSKAGLAKHVGKDRQTIYRWCSGENNPSFREVVLIAEYLQVEPLWLFGADKRDPTMESLFTIIVKEIGKLKTTKSLQIALDVIENLQKEELKAHKSKPAKEG
jgi:transcriptional regulator with XRE-family HTH domain